MLKVRYKRILDKLPQGLFVFDKKLRVRCTNAAFRRTVSGKATKGRLSLVLGCGEKGKCGEGESCAYCAFLRTMRAACTERTEKTETVRAHVERGGRHNEISVSIRILPLDEKGELFLGLTESAYRTEMEREMLSAGQVQRRLLPAGKSMAGVNYSYMYVPCFEVGGDLPDVYELNGQAYGVLADVSGKGLSAGILSAFVKAGFDKKEENLGRALSRLSAKFNELEQDERSYVTVAAVRIDKASGVLRYSIAGHNAPLLLKNDYGIHEIESPAPPISNWLPDFPYAEKELPFQRGDVLVLLTDGVTECVNGKGEFFGIERAESVLLQSHGAEDFIGKLKAALNVFSGGKFSDDITAIAFDL